MNAPYYCHRFFIEKIVRKLPYFSSFSFQSESFLRFHHHHHGRPGAATKDPHKTRVELLLSVVCETGASLSQKATNLLSSFVLFPLTSASNSTDGRASVARHNPRHHSVREAIESLVTHDSMLRLAI